MPYLIGLLHDLELTSPFLVRFAVDVVAMVALVFGLYYRRYKDKELVTSAALFNIFVFGILSVLSAVNFNVAAGFGLFAILALFTLRSEPLTKMELTYFFGSVVVAVISAIEGAPIHLVLVAVVAVLLGAWIFDHPRLLKTVGATKLQLDAIDRLLLSDSKAMKQKLSERLGVEVLSFTVTQIDYITEKASINVYFRHQ